MATSVKWMKNLGGAKGPLIIKGLIQPGSTESFGMGEFVVWQKTADNWIGLDSKASAQLYLLGIANEEINVLNTRQARYTEIIVPRPDDVFAIELASAASVEYGHTYYPTGSGNPQTATLDADGYGILNAVGDGNYPTIEELGGTTITSTDYGYFTINPNYSYYSRLVNSGADNNMKVYHITAAVTLLEEWSGMLVSNLGCTAAYVVDLPQDCNIGVQFKVACAADFDIRLHSAGGGIYVKGGKQADSKYVGIEDIGDFCHVVHIGANDWLAYGSISGADADISVET